MSKKQILFLSIAIVLALICGILIGYYLIPKNVTSKSSTPTTTVRQNGQQTQTKLPEKSTSSNQSTGNNETLPKSSKTYTAYGRFVGETDTHSAELDLINTDFDFKSFELSDTAKKELQNSSYQEGQLVKIEFEVVSADANPKILKIEIPQIAILQGKFIGLSDNNFAEFVFDKQHVVLQVTDVLDKVSNLDTNTDVKVEIENNPSDYKANLVVKSLEILK